MEKFEILIPGKLYRGNIYNVFVLDGLEYRDFDAQQLKVKASFGIKCACINVEVTGEFQFTGSSDMSRMERTLLHDAIYKRLNP